jgi:polar amino acid transport system ATP-binding protein
MRDLAAGGTTMLVVTHEMGFAREAATDAIFLEDGRIVEDGPPEQLFENPQKDRTAQFLERITSMYDS